MVELNLSYYNIINSLIVQFFLIACIVLFLMTGGQPRSALVPPALLARMQGTARP